MITLDVPPSDDGINATQEEVRTTLVDDEDSAEEVLINDATNSSQTSSDMTDDYESNNDTSTVPSLPIPTIQPPTPLSSSSSSSKMNVNIYLESIDLGFNVISVHGRDFDTKQKAFCGCWCERIYGSSIYNEVIIPNKVSDMIGSSNEREQFGDTYAFLCLLQICLLLASSSVVVQDRHTQ